jgi:hypothetical protein
MALTNTKILPLQLDATVKKMFYDEFLRAQPLWPRFMQRETAPAGEGSYFSRADLAGLGGTLNRAYEGEAVEYDVPSEGNKILRYYYKFQKGFQVTEEMNEDSMFDKIRALPGSLARVADNTIEAQVALLFNYATATTYGTTKDGLAMAADAHHTTRSPAGTAYDNNVAADLDTTSLQAAHQWFQNLVGEDDLPIDAYMTKLMVGLNDQWKAYELMKATGRVFDTGGASNTGLPNKGLVNNGGTYYAATGAFGENTVRPGFGIMNHWQDIIVNRFLTDADEWVAFSNYFDGKVRFKRPVKMQSADDLATGNKLYRCSTRFRAYIDEWRGIYCSTGA